MPMRPVSRCDRCGEELPGGWRWMFHQGNAAREFHCDRCGRILAIQGVVGLSLLGLLLLVLAGVTVWLRWLR